MVTVLIAGGGTGGHVFPMLAVGQALRAVAPESEVFYVGTERGMEARLVPEAGGELVTLDVAPLRGGGLGGFARGVLKAFASLRQSRALVRARRPDVVLSVGGYAGGPIALAARLMGVPLAILEPNSVFGFTNRLLGPLSNRVYWAFGELDKGLRPGVAMRSGVPLRQAFEPAPYRPEPGRFHVVVIGGSQGAQAFNEHVPAAFAKLRAAVPHATILHQSGRGRGDATRAAYADAPGVVVTEFVRDVAAELRGADVVIQRCGAGSLAELCLVGRASILVPFPFAVDQHQKRNAESLAQDGAAELCEQGPDLAGDLGARLVALANDPERRARMAASVAAHGKPDAARAVAADLVALARGGEPREAGRGRRKPPQSRGES